MLASFRPGKLEFSGIALAGILCAAGCGGGSSVTNFLLTVSKTGTGSGAVTSSPAGIDCGMTCSASYSSGTVVTLTAVPAAGTSFGGWSGGGCSGSGTCAVAMDGAKAVAASLKIPRVVFDSPRKLDGSDAASANRTSNIWRMNADSTALTAVTNATFGGADSISPQWSPDGTRVVFESSRKIDGSDAANPNHTFNIWRVNVDGTGLTALTNLTARRADSNVPQWSPDGSRVVFHSGRKLDGSDAANANFTFNIWRVNSDGTGLTALTTVTFLGANSLSPQWSPDGSRVVFESSRKLDGSDAANANLTYNIWRVNSDGTGLIALTSATANGADSSSPQWSPDGSRVVFNSRRKLDGTDAANANGTSNIWRVNADGTALTILTNATANLAHSFAPQWSPDGTRVVFYSYRKIDGSDAANPTPNIWRVNADGTGLTTLTRAPASRAASGTPQWSPDGSRVVFISARNLDGSDSANLNNTYNIWRVNADGTALTIMTNATASGADNLEPQYTR